jgi:hypothetical protein
MSSHRHLTDQSRLTDVMDKPLLSDISAMYRATPFVAEL